MTSQQGRCALDLVRCRSSWRNGQAYGPHTAGWLLQELTISYAPLHLDIEERDEVCQQYGFTCRCQRCQVTTLLASHCSRENVRAFPRKERCLTRSPTGSMRLQLQMGERLTRVRTGHAWPSFAWQIYMSCVYCYQRYVRS